MLFPQILHVKKVKLSPRFSGVRFRARKSEAFGSKKTKKILIERLCNFLIIDCFRFFLFRGMGGFSDLIVNYGKPLYSIWMSTEVTTPDVRNYRDILFQ